MTAVHQQVNGAAECGRILVTGGTRATRRIVAALLARNLEKAAITTASNACEARHLPDHHHFDSVTTSAELPDSSGLAQVCHYRDLIDTVRASLKEGAASLDTRVIETDAEQLSRAVDLMMRIRHDLHLPYANSD